MVTSFALEPGVAIGLPQTVVRWQGDVTISGRLSSFGPQGLLDRIARKNVDTFIQGICDGLNAKGV
jgi:carbon monoxide dehydrogenase subunit G